MTKFPNPSLRHNDVSKPATAASTYGPDSHGPWVNDPAQSPDPDRGFSTMAPSTAASASAERESRF